jgi:uncharacterized protein HemY
MVGLGHVYYFEKQYEKAEMVYEAVLSKKP